MTERLSTFDLEAVKTRAARSIAMGGVSWDIIPLSPEDRDALVEEVMMFRTFAAELNEMMRTIYDATDIPS